MGKSTEEALSGLRAKIEMPNTFEDLCEEAVKNCRKDRERLEKYVDQTIKNVTGEIPPEIALDLANSIVQVSEALTKSNAQLILAAQLKLKKDSVSTKSESDEFSDNERKNMFTEIETPNESN